jgi:hypothetical protein
MEKVVQFLIGLAIGTGILSVYFYSRSRAGGERAELYRGRMRQAVTIFGLSAAPAILGKILIWMR